jgi:hypothetical protein
MGARQPEFRSNDEKAAAVLSRLVPREADRQKLAQVFADSCRQAHLQSPSCWELTLHSSFPRLNVGQVALLDVKGGELFLCAASGLPRLGRPAVVTRSKSPVHAAVPVSSASLRLPVRSLRMLDDRVLAAHRRYIAAAASQKRISPWRAAHSPAAVRVLSGWSGTNIPQPGYVAVDPDASELSQRETSSPTDSLTTS